jgi:hypothetical protein
VPDDSRVAMRISHGSVKAASIVGILLVILGVIGLAYQGIGYTKKKDIVDVGPIHATADEHKTIPIPPVLGGMALVGGIALLIASAKSGS